MSLLSITEWWSSSSALDKARPIVKWIGDLVFPLVCAGCGRVDFRFCRSCEAVLEELPIALITKNTEQVNAMSATGKHVGLLRKSILALKYEGATELAEPLAARLHTAINAYSFPVDALVPVPLSPERLAERGYNQSELLGGHLGSSCGIACRPGWLRRIRHAGQQARLSEAARRENVKDAFVASEDVRDHSILLIDDVMTTGSTLTECARALREKGAAAVYALTVSDA